MTASPSSIVSGGVVSAITRLPWTTHRRTGFSRITSRGDGASNTTRSARLPSSIPYSSSTPSVLAPRHVRH